MQRLDLPGGYNVPFRWYPIQNTDTEPAPPYGILQVTGVDANGNFTVTRPTADSITTFLINGPGTVPPNAYGQATASFPAIVGYDPDPAAATEDDSVPQVGQTWGTQAGRWTMGADSSGLYVLGGGAADGFVNVMVQLAAQCDSVTVAIPGLVCPVINGSGVVTGIVTEYQNWQLWPCPVPVGDPYCLTSPTNCCPEIGSGCCTTLTTYLCVTLTHISGTSSSWAGTYLLQICGGNNGDWGAWSSNCALLPGASTVNFDCHSSAGITTYYLRAAFGNIPGLGAGGTLFGLGEIVSPSTGGMVNCGPPFTANFNVFTINDLDGMTSGSYTASVTSVTSPSDCSGSGSGGGCSISQGNLGQFASGGAVSSFTVVNITVTGPALLRIAVAVSGSATAPLGVTYDGIGLTLGQNIATGAGSPSGNVQFWYKPVASPTTANIVITLAGPAQILAIVSEVIGLVSNTTDAGTSATGLATTPDTGSTGATVVACELAAMAFYVVSDAGPDTPGNGFGGLASISAVVAGLTVTLWDGYQVLTTTQTVDGLLTTSVAVWAGIVETWS